MKMAGMMANDADALAGMTCEQELRAWRATALSLIALIVLAVAARSALLLRAYLRRQAGPEKPLYAALEDGENADFSDSMSDSSSLFSPPFRTSEGVGFKTAAANVSQTELYLQRSVSREQIAVADGNKVSASASRTRESEQGLEDDDYYFDIQEEEEQEERQDHDQAAGAAARAPKSRPKM